MKHYTKYLAEFIGTFALASIVMLSVTGTFTIATPLLAALTLGLFVYTVGHISGTHINPAVTLGLWSIKKITTEEAGKYVAVQLAAGVCAYLLSMYMHPYAAASMGPMSTDAFIGEVVGTFFFTFGIAALVYDKVPSVMSGMVVGGSLLLGISFAALLGSIGSLNPAVALGLGVWNILYIVAPIVGSVAGFKAYEWMR